MKTSEGLGQLQRAIASLHHQVVHHPLLNEINTPQRLACFMEHHVFAVWDFMSLLKTLYQKIAGTTVPWQPSLYPDSVYFIGQIMSEEEADVFSEGDSEKVRHCSHFEAYLCAMEACGANTAPIQALLAWLQSGGQITHSLPSALNIPPAAESFIQSTFAAFQEPVYSIAAGFVFAREGITGELFAQLLKQDRPGGLALPPAFKYYLTRHIELDNESHYPKALAMLKSLCGKDSERWQAATVAATKALQARCDFWSGILEAFK